MANERFIQHQLRRTSLQVKLVDLFGGLMLVACAVLAILLVAVLVDAWVMDLGVVGRLLTVAAIATVTGVFLFVYLLPLLVRRINPLYAALVIEQSEPSLKNSLINLLTFHCGRSSAREQVVYQALQEQAAQDLSRVPVESAVDRSKLIRVGYLLTALMIVCGLYTVLSPKSPFQTLARIVSPLAPIRRPARVVITEVKPGDTEIFRGQTLQVTARFTGLVPTDRPTLLYTTADGQTVDAPVEMTLADNGVQYRCTVSPGEQGIQQDLDYQLMAGDARSQPYHVTVLDKPAIVVERLRYDFPKYTGRPSKTADHQGDIHALEGTRVTVFCRANQPLKAAYLQLLPDLPENESATAPVGLLTRTISMETSGMEASGQFVLRLDDQRRKSRYSHYRVRMLSQRGDHNENPVIHTIKVVPDLPPEVDILQPRRDELELPEDRTATIEARALDPDYGLTRLRLRGQAGEASLLDHTLWQSGSGQRGQQIRSFQLRPRQLGLKAGSTLKYWAEAEDNRHSTTTGKPEPNVARTRQYVIRIVEPIGRPQVDHPADRPDEPEKPEMPGRAQPPNERPGAKEPNGQPAEATGAGGAKPESAQQQPDRPDQQAAEGSHSGDQAVDQDSKPQDQPPGQSGQAPAGDQGQSGGGQNQGQGDAGAGQKAGNSGQSGQNRQDSDQPGQGSGRADQSGQSRSGQHGSRPDGSSSQQGQAAESQGGEGRSDAGQSNQSQSGQGSGGHGGQPTEPLHPGEVFERVLEHMQRHGADQQQGGQPAGQAAPQQQPTGPDQPAGSPSPGGPLGTQQPGGSGAAAAGSPAEKGQPAQRQASAGQGQTGMQSKEGQPGRPPGGSAEPPTGSSDQHGGQPKSGGSQGQQSPSQGGQSGQKGASAQSQGGQCPHGNNAGSCASCNKPGGASGGAGSTQGSSGGQSGSSGGRAGQAGQSSAQQGASQAGQSGSQGGGQQSGQNSQQQGSGQQSGGSGGQGQQGANQQTGGQGQQSTPSGRNSGGQSGQAGSNSSSGGSQQTGGQAPAPATLQQGPNQQTGQQQSGGSQQQEEQVSGPSSGQSKPHHAQSSESGNQSGQGRQGGGQSAAQTGGGNSGGGSMPSDQGSGAAAEPGAGPESQPGAGDIQSQQPTGVAGSQPGAGNTQRAGGSRSGGSTASGAASGGDNTGPFGGSGGTANTVTNTEVASGPMAPGDEANLEYARKATDLVLDYLKDQQDRPDPQLLRELNWTEDELRRFIERWDALKRRAKTDAMDGRRELDEALRSLGLRPRRDRRRSDNARNDAFRNLLDAGAASKPPPEYQEKFNAFLRGTARVAEDR